MLGRLLDELVPLIGNEVSEIIVVDNASSDETASLMTSYDQVQYLRNDVNHMSAYARQQGWERATGEYVCFIDDDNLLENNAISKMADSLDLYPELGVVAPIQRRWSDKSIWCAGGRINHLLVVKYDRKIHSSKRYVEVDFQPNVFMVRNDLLQRNVYFDWKRFPHNWSEADFGNQVRQIGLKVGTLPDATIFHDIDYSGYFTRINPTNIFDQARSRVAYRKAYHNDLATWLIFAVFILPVSTIALVLTTRRRSDRKRLVILYLKGTLCGILTCGGKSPQAAQRLKAP